MKPSTLIASTGNTQGIRFSTSPPISAPSSAQTKVVAGTAVGAAGGGALAPALALAFSAASSAGDTPAGKASAGQAPATGASARQPRSPATNTSVIFSGLSARSGETGTSAVQTSPSQCWLQLRAPTGSPGLAGVAAVTTTPGDSGNSSSGWPRTSTGKPATRTARRLPSSFSATWCAPATSAGWLFSAASNAAPFNAVELRRGILRANSPSCGMHSLRHTSQVALSLTSSASASTPGLYSGVMMSGTGSSTVPS